MKLYEFRYIDAALGSESRVDIVARDIHTAIDVFLRHHRGCEIEWILLKSSKVLLG